RRRVGGVRPPGGRHDAAGGRAPDDRLPRRGGHTGRGAVDARGHAGTGAGPRTGHAQPGGRGPARPAGCGLMTGRPLSWSDEAHEVMAGDLTVAVAYLTPAGGAVVTSVSPVGIVDRATGRVGFTTSLGFPKKLVRILHDPHVAVAYHTRLHGFAAHDGYVLAQGSASVDLSPSARRLARVMDASEDFLGRAKRGTVWDWLLREYHQERVFVDIDVARLATWPDLSARGPMTVAGPSWPRPPDPQRPPAKGTAPRVGVPGLARQIAPLPHRLLAYRGADGHPVVLPVRVTGHDEDGLRLTAPPGLLPPGGRRAGFLAH